MGFVDRMSNIMDYSVRKREAITNNIANQATPNYKAEVVNWNEELNKALSLKTTNSGHIPLSQNSENFSIERDYSTEVNSDGNNVDMNNEIVEMMKNNQIYSMSLRAINFHYEAMGAARGK